MTSNSLPWNSSYKSDIKIWGDKPSELAVVANNYLRESQSFKDRKDIFLLDVGCGYGRDDIFLAQNLPCHILGLDNSQAAIDIARQSLKGSYEKKIEFLCFDFSDVSDKYDVIFISNLYYLIQPDERTRLRENVRRCLKLDGILFFSTLSVRDTQFSDKNIQGKTSPDSWIDFSHFHLSTREELEKDFDFLNIFALYEREIRQPRSMPENRHIFWILMGNLK